MKYEKRFYPACREGDVALVREALAGGFPVDHLSKYTVDENFWVTSARSGLMWATIDGQIDVVRVLLKAGASPDAREFIPNMQAFAKPSGFRTSWAFAAEFNRREIMELFFAEAKRPDAQHLVDCLEHAAKCGSLDIVKLLLDRGVLIDALASDNGTPLMSAAQYGRTAIVEHLLQRGAAVNLYGPADEENDGELAATALHCAILGLSYRKLTYDADGNVVDGPTTDDYLKCIKLLLDAGANPNLEQKGVGYPLAQAVRSPAAVKLLLAAGADPSLC